MTIYSEKFLNYLNSIGEIPKDIELDVEHDKISYRYIQQAIYLEDGGAAYSPIRHGEVIVNGEIIGYYKEVCRIDLPDEEKDSFNYKEANPFISRYIHGTPSIRRQWGNTKFIWCNERDLN